MTCPLCAAELERATLLTEADGVAALRGFRCPHEHGVFLAADLYFAWREGHEVGAEPGGIVPSSDEVGDVKRAKLCPQDGRIMSRFRTSHDGGFWLDRCATCGGIWFDGDEWDATVRLGLLDHLPSFFSDAWRRQVERESAERSHEVRLRERVGADDLGRVDEFRDWLWAHPERGALMARLTERPEA